MARIERSVDIGAPLAQVFAFVTDIHNHARVVPPETQEELLDAGGPLLQQGTVVRMRARYGGVRWTLASRITAFEPPDPARPDTAYFRDEQVSGPFGLWIHEHWFEARSSECTRLTDRFTYAAPFGVLGTALERLWLDRSLRRLLEFMHTSQKRLLETAHTTP